MYDKVRSWTPIARKGGGELVNISGNVFEKFVPKVVVFVCRLCVIKDEKGFLVRCPTVFKRKIAFPTTNRPNMSKRPHRDINDMRRWFLLMDMVRKQ